MKLIKESNALCPLGGYQDIIKNYHDKLWRNIMLMFNQCSCLIVDPLSFNSS